MKSFWTLLHEKLAARPDLIAVARENCSRWLREDHSAPEPLRRWEALLAAAEAGPHTRERLFQTLTGSDDDSARLREFHPFAGILTREERRQARELCGYRH